MKKYLLIIGIILIPVVVYAWGILGISGGGVSCPAWYADANVVFSWDGQHDDGHNTGCENDGTTRAADTDTATTTTFDSQIVIDLDDSQSGVEKLEWEQPYIDGSDAAQTICVKTYVTGARPTAAVIVAKGGDGVNDQFFIQTYTSADRIIGYFQTEAGPDPDAQGDPMQFDGWYTWGFSWNVVGDADDISTNPGDEPTPANWGSGWEEDAGEATSDMTSVSTEFSIGNDYASAPNEGQHIYISQVAIVTGYQFDCSSLTGW